MKNLKYILFFLFALCSSFANNAYAGSNFPSAIGEDDQKKPLQIFNQQDCDRLNIKPLELQLGEILMPRYDGKNYFIDADGMRPTADDIPGQFKIDEALRNPGSSYVIENVGDIVSGLAGLDFKRLPMVLHIQGNDSGKEITVVILSIIFYQDKTVAQAGILSQLPNTKAFLDENGQQQRLYFGSEVTLKKGGAMGGKFELIAPKKLTFFTLKDYAKISLTVGTGICLGCSAREGSTSDLLVFLSGMIELGPRVAKVEDDNGIIVKGSDGLDAIPKLLFSVNMPSWQKLRIEATLPAKYGVQLTMLPFIGFKSISNGGIQDESKVKDKFLCSTSTKVIGTNIIYDFNEHDEDGIDRGDGVKATGLIFKNLSVRLPKELKDAQGKVVKLDVKFLAIGENGISGEVSTKQQANNYLLNPKIEGVFDLGITEVAIKIEKNKLTKYRIAGDLELPLLSDYGMVFSLEKGEEKITDPITKIQSSNDILSFTAGLKNTSKTINCTLFGTGIEVTGLRPARGTIPAASVGAVLAKGQLNLTTGDFKDFGVVFNYGSFKLLSYSLDFDKIAITTKPPYLEEFALTPTKDGLFEIAGFKFGISSLSIKGNTATKLITGSTTATIDVKNGTNQPIKMTAGLIFQAEVVKNDEGKTKFKFNYFRPEKIHVAADFPTFGFDADLDIFENQPRLGVSNLSGIEGKSKFWFNFMDGGSKAAKEESKKEQEKTKGGAGVYLLFAKDNKNENAWAIDVDVNFPTPGILLVPPPSAPIFLKGVFGGAYSNLKINGDVINKVVGSDKGSRTGLSYTWDPGRWGFNIGLDFSATPTIDVSAMLAVEGKVKEGLSFIKAAGYAKFKVSLNDLLPGVGDKLSKGFNQVINKVNKIPGITEFPTVENLKSLKTTEEIAKGSKKNGEDSFAALFNKVPEDGDGNRVAAGIILALNFENGGLNSLSIKMYPDIHVNLKNLFGNTSLASTGYGLLFISRDKKYLHLGSSKQLSDRLGLNFQAGIDAGKAGSLGLKAFVNAYFMLGDDVPITLPAPIVPAIFAAKFASKSNDILSGRGENFEGGTIDSLRKGSGLAFGAAVGVAVNLNIAYVFTVDADVGAGFDALLVNKVAPCVEGWGGGSGGNGWKAQAQVYGYAAAKVTILSIPIVEFGVGFLLKASVPKPFYAEGYFAAYIRIWKAEVNINIRGKIGDATCPLEKNEKDKVLIKESFTLIDNFTPNNKIGSKPTISTTANLYLKCKYPKDQVGVSGVLGVNKFKQEVIVTLKNADGSTILDTDGKDKYVFTDATINPKEKLNEAIKISFGKKLDKNTSYKAEVKTRIYTTETYSETDDGGRTVATTDVNETVHYTKKEGDKIYDVSLEQSEVYSFNTTGEDFNLEESDVLIYPAKNQYNVYKSDFGGSGFLQIDPVVAKKIQENCTSCDLRVGIYKDGVGVTTAIADITTGTDFLLNVDADQIYEIRVLGTVEGQTKTLYKDHYFRASKNNSFELKVKGIETALKPSWVGTELRFDLLTNSLSPDESFSNEEMGDSQLKKSLSLQISTNKVPSWFQNVTDKWSSAGGQGLTWGEKEIACKQTQYPFLKGNSVDFVKSQDNNSYASPAFIFSPFEQTILQLLKDIAADESGTVGNFMIPKLIEETELCFTIENDISKLSYYDDHSNIQLPARFTKLNAPICFKSPEEVDFMDKSKLERTVTVSCTIGSFDSTPIIYSFEMKSSDGKIIPFPANFTVTGSNKPLKIFDRDLNTEVDLQSDRYTNVQDYIGDRNSTGTKQIVSYGSIRKSINGCPTNTAFSGVGTGISSVSTKFIVNTLEATPIKPCLSVKDYTNEAARDECIAACGDDDTGCKSACNGNLYSSEKKFLIESWENNSRLDPQKSRKVISLSLSNGETRFFPDKTSSHLITIDPSKLAVLNGKPLSIVVSETSDYVCGENLGDIKLKLPAIATSGKGNTIAEACQSTESSVVYCAENVSSLVKNNSLFYEQIDPNVQLITKNFYTIGSGDTREVFVFNAGKYQQKYFCGNNPQMKVTCTSSSTTTTNNTSFSLKLEFFSLLSDGSKRYEFPWYIPESGLNIDGYLIEKDKITSSPLTIDIPKPTNGVNQYWCQYLGYKGISNIPNVVITSPPKGDCATKPTKPVLTSSTGTSSAKYGENITISATGCSGKVIWSGRTETTSSITQVISSASTFYANCLNESTNCLSEISSITVNTQAIIIESDKDIICGVTPITLTARGCSATPIWTCDDPALDLSKATGITFTVSPSKNTVFKLKCRINENISQTVSRAFDYHEAVVSPSITNDVVAKNKNTICQGESVIFSTINACKASETIAWSNNQVSATITVSPVSNTVFSAVCKDAFCSSPKSNEISITVPNLNKATISGNATNDYVCSGKPFVLTATNCDAQDVVHWYKKGENTILGTSATITLNATTTQSYVAKCRRQIADDGSKWCDGLPSDEINIKAVTPSDLALSLSISSSTICAYRTADLSVRVGNIGVLEWQMPGTTVWSALNGNAKYYTTNVAGTYKVRCNLNDNCFNSEHSSGSDINKILTVNAEPAGPTLSTNISTNTICAGQSISLSGTCGVGTIGWNNLTQNPVTLTNSQTFAAVCKNNGCETQKASTIDVKVNPIPAKPTFASSKGLTFCEYEQTDLTAVGCNGTITWGDNTTVNPIKNISKVTGEYSYKATCEELGCSSLWSDEVKLKIRPKPPTPLIEANYLLICLPSKITLTAKNCDAGTVVWSDGGRGLSRMYDSEGKNSLTAKCYMNDCEGDVSNQLNLEVRPQPSIPTITGTVSTCVGNTIDIKASCVIGNVVWRDALPSIAAQGTFTYRAYCEKNSCTNGDNSFTSTVYSYPSKPVIAESQQCGYTKLSVDNCGGTVKWSNGTEAKSIDVTAKGSYTAYCSQNDCQTEESITTKDIKQQPNNPEVSGNHTLCEGSSVDISASCSIGNVSWNEVIPTVAKAGKFTFKAKCSKDGCESGEASFDLTVNTFPSKPVIVESRQCGYTTLSVDNCDGTVKWSNDVEAKSIDVTTSATYRAYCNRYGCQTAESITTQSIKQKPTAPNIMRDNDSVAKIMLCNDAKATLISTSDESEWYSSKLENKAPFFTGGTLTDVTEGVYKARLKTDGCYSDFSNEMTLENVIVTTPIIALDESSPCNPKMIITNTCEGSVSWYYRGDTPKIIIGDPLSLVGRSSYFAVCVKDGCKSGESNKEGKFSYPDKYSDWQDNKKRPCYGGKHYKQEQDMNPCSPTTGTTRDIFESDAVSNWQKDGDEFTDKCKVYQNYKDLDACSSTSGDIDKRFVKNSDTTPNWTQDSNSGTCNGQKWVDKNSCSSTYNTVRCLKQYRITLTNYGSEANDPRASCGYSYTNFDGEEKSETIRTTLNSKSVIVYSLSTPKSGVCNSKGSISITEITD